MNAPHDYAPMFRTAELPPYVPPVAPSKFKTLKAFVMVHGHGSIPIQHAARGHAFAFIESGAESRWWFRRGAASEELFADLITSADKRGRRWRVVHVISGEIRSEG
jgi:hypothetical protein